MRKRQAGQHPWMYVPDEGQPRCAPSCLRPGARYITSMAIAIFRLTPRLPLSANAAGTNAAMAEVLLSSISLTSRQKGADLLADIEAVATFSKLHQKLDHNRDMLVSPDQHGQNHSVCPVSIQEVMRGVVADMRAGATRTPNGSLSPSKIPTKPTPFRKRCFAKRQTTSAKPCAGTVLWKRASRRHMFRIAPSRLSQHSCTGCAIGSYLTCGPDLRAHIQIYRRGTVLHISRCWSCCGLSVTIGKSPSYRTLP